MKRCSHVLLALWAWLARGVSLALIPALASETVARGAAGVVSTPSGQRHGPSFGVRLAANRPYLAVVLPRPLRFEAPPPPIDSHIPSAAPPNPGGPAEETALANRDSVAPSAEPSPAAQEAPASAAPPSARPAPASLPTPVSVIPDDTPRDIQPQDVLPYFQFPGSPPPLPPPSSATYRRR
jgi:hypothetical protein